MSAGGSGCVIERQGEKTTQCHGAGFYRQSANASKGAPRNVLSITVRKKIERERN